MNAFAPRFTDFSRSLSELDDVTTATGTAAKRTSPRTVLSISNPPTLGMFKSMTMRSGSGAECAARLLIHASPSVDLSSSKLTDECPQRLFEEQHIRVIVLRHQNSDHWGGIHWLRRTETSRFLLLLIRPQIRP